MRVRCSAVSVPLALILVSVLLLLPVLQPAQAESRTAPLEALSWERRVLLLFADHPADPWAYKQRLDLLEDRCDFNNRDLVLLEVYADHAVRVTGVWLDGLAHEEQALSETHAGRRSVAAAVEAAEAVVPVVQLPDLDPVLAPNLDPAPGLVLNVVIVLALLPAGAAPDPEDLVNESPDQSAFLIEPSHIFLWEKCKT